MEQPFERGESGNRSYLDHEATTSIGGGSSQNLLNELIKFNLDTEKKIVEVDIPIRAIVDCLEEEFCVFENEYETLVIKIDGKTLTTYMSKQNFEKK